MCSISTIAFAFSTVDHDQPVLRKDFSGCGQNEADNDQPDDRLYFQYYPGSAADFRSGDFSGMGIRGAALATGLGQVFTVIVYLIAYKKCSIPVEICRKYLELNRNLDGKLYMVGIPAILNIALPSVLISFLNQILSAFSGSYVVVLGIYYKLQTFLYLPASGIVQGMRPLIGYNYGAGEIKRVKKLFGISVLLNGMIMLAGTIICFTASETLMGMFTREPGNCKTWHCSITDYQYRVYPICHLCYSFRCIRRTEQRCSVPGDFVIKIYYSDHSGSLSAVLFCRGRCCVECVLDL